MAESIYNKLSKERKELQAQGLVPEWYTTGGYQLFVERYQYQTNGRSVRGQFERIAKTAAKHLVGTKFYDGAEQRFFDLLWSGELSTSTPVLANMGTDRGLPISCMGSVVQDSVEGFYENLAEIANLTKHGFGTASDFSRVRPRGSPISVGGKANGAVPVIKDHVQAMRSVSQGGVRRGAFAAYLDIDHGDFWELANLLLNETDDLNVGWTIKDSFIERLDQGDTEAVARYQRVLKIKMVTGKGYFFFIDKANRNRPQWYKDQGLFINSPQLCNEIMLSNDEHRSYSCVLSSVNLTHWDKIKDSDSVYWMTIFLDCVVSEFLEKAKDIKWLQKVVRFTREQRAVGLGQAGLHSLFMSKMIPFESYEAHILNLDIAAHIQKESIRASEDMSKEMGEPEVCKGYGRRNTHLQAPAPTKSTAAIMGGISEGINPDPAMAFTALTSAGAISRVSPPLLKLMKEKGVYNQANIQQILDTQGSVQGVDWLTDDEKKVFLTAFEINQEAIIRMASARGRYIDQWQSLNLFFSATEDPAWISHIHQLAFKDPRILGLYYVYTQAGVQASKDECVACQ